MQENQELRTEIERKEKLLERHTEKLKRCQLVLKGEAQPSSISQQQQQSQQQQSQSIQQLSSHPQTQAQSHVGPSGGHLPQYSQQSHGTPGSGGMAPNPGPYQSYPTTLHSQAPIQGQQAGMQSHSMGTGARQQPPPSYPQGPLAFLEQTTSNIGLPERR